MKVFAIIATTLAAAVAAGSYDECSAPTTVTITVTEPGYPEHTPTGPGSTAPSLPPYPTTSAPYPSVYPTGTAPVPSGTAPVPVPSGSGSYNPTPPEFTGAANSLNIGGALAGVGALAAFFL